MVLKMVATTMSIIVAATMIMLIVAPLPLRAVEAYELEGKAAARRINVSSMLVFGDSSVDPGNNNVLRTSAKSNFLPYGKNFIDGRPTGRFCNGRLATDFIAEAIGLKKAIPGFLDPALNKSELLNGVSFASASSGYDDLTANLSNVLSVTKQLKYFLHYKIHLRQLVGKLEADKIINRTIFLLSMGTNDFLQNYYLEPIRSNHFTLDQYQNYLISSAARDIKTMHRLGATRLVVVGVPPLGCMPIVKTLQGEGDQCVDKYNKVALSFNYKMRQMLSKLNLNMQTAFIDVYGIMDKAITNPGKYGIVETSKGCCGTGRIEYGDTCKGLSTCSNPEGYVFWDAVHPTEKMYKIIADEALNAIDPRFFTA